ncbi:hypothetical protein ACIP4W_40560 [Streptomyces sp. NPDC088846]|uniref:hypothetical protein n=1 Tax=Streptomyces sp. NPDC088846 TaxID=3365908 RepID=UPI00381B4B1C
MTTVDNESVAEPTTDWWGRLYEEAEDTFGDPVTLPVPQPEAPAVPQQSRDRLPRWWERKSTDVLKPPAPETEASETTEGEEETGQQDDVQAPAAPAEPGTTGQETGGTSEPTMSPDHQVFYPQPGYWGPAQAMAEKVTPPRPAISPGTRRLFYNVGAGGAGWLFGLTPALSEAIETAGVAISIGGALTLGIGTCLAIAAIWDRRTRHWIPPLAWAARIPLMSAITALALYAPAAPH